MEDRIAERVVVKQERELQEDIPSLGSPETQQVEAGSLGLLPVKFEPTTDECSIKQEFEVEIVPAEFYKLEIIGAPHTQTTQEIGDSIIETHNDQNTYNLRHFVPVRVDNKAAERSRLYRERHREEINQRRRDVRQRQKNLHQIHTVSIPATAAERNRIYREQNRQEINKRRRDSRQRQKILHQINFESIPATAAERNRNYRERNRQEINKRRRDSRQRQQNLQRMHTECNINNIDAIEQITTPNDQQSLNSSNDNIIQEIAHNFISIPQQHNTQHFEETQNDRGQTTTTALQTTKGQKSNSFSNFHLHKFAHKHFIDNERLPSPRIPFMQIRRLRHVHGQYMDK